MESFYHYAQEMVTKENIKAILKTLYRWWKSEAAEEIADNLKISKGNIFIIFRENLGMKKLFP